MTAAVSRLREREGRRDGERDRQMEMDGERERLITP